MATEEHSMSEPKGLASDDAAWITGAVLDVAGGAVLV
jgi:hypothetical protein